jgi:hypothetical protein
MRAVRGRGLRGLTGVCTTRVLWPVASKLTRGKKLSKPPGIRLSPGIFSWVELVQVLDVPRVRNILAFGML